MSASYVCTRGLAGSVGVRLVLAVFVLSAPAHATVFYVAQAGGSDTNDGSEANPLLTISACATRASAGDTCRVHAGTYRETVTMCMTLRTRP